MGDASVQECQGGFCEESEVFGREQALKAGIERRYGCNGKVSIVEKEFLLRQSFGLYVTGLFFYILYKVLGTDLLAFVGK